MTLTPQRTREGDRERERGGKGVGREEREQVETVCPFRFKWTLVRELSLPSKSW